MQAYSFLVSLVYGRSWIALKYFWIWKGNTAYLLIHNLLWMLPWCIVQIKQIVQFVPLHRQGDLQPILAPLQFRGWQNVMTIIYWLAITVFTQVFCVPYKHQIPQQEISIFDNHTRQKSTSRAL